MATSKLIKPTNVTVQIPEFTDQPDQRVNSNCIDKGIDGINSLSDQIAKEPEESKVMQKYFDSTYGYYGIETKNIAQGTDGYLAILFAPGANRLQLKYTVGTTTTTKNYTLTAS